MPYVSVNIDLDDALEDACLDDIADYLRAQDYVVTEGAKSSGAPEDHQGNGLSEGESITILCGQCFEARRAGDTDKALELIDRINYAIIGRMI